jgi:hypothetical protein
MNPYNMNTFDQSFANQQTQAQSVSASWKPPAQSPNGGPQFFQQQQQQQPMLYNHEQETLQQPNVHYQQQGMQPQQQPQSSEPQPTIAQIPPLSNEFKQQQHPDQHSYAGMSDVTSEPGY